MNDRDRLDCLLAEIATTPLDETPDLEALDLLTRACEDDARFAREAAGTLLAARTLHALSADAPDFHFVPPRAPSRARSLLLPAAALLLGILLGRIWTPEERESEPPISELAEPLRFEIAGSLAERVPLESALAYRPHHYENGFLAGKTLRVETSPR